MASRRRATLVIAMSLPKGTLNSPSILILKRKKLQPPFQGIKIDALDINHQYFVTRKKTGNLIKEKKRKETVKFYAKSKKKL
jgi:hypothetical protein